MFALDNINIHIFYIRLYVCYVGSY